MIIPTAAEILQMLQQAKPRPTSDAPRDARGIYGLFDHTGAFRYIGSTSSEAETFHKRIHQRHRTGSETHSHYFARMYNTGRMWVDRKDPNTVQEMKIVRRLRQAFIGRYCGAVWVPLPDHAPIAQLEAEVIALAPAEMIGWNRRGMDAYDEPVELVDALIESLSLSPFERAAIGRQESRFRGVISVPSVNRALSATSGSLPVLPEGPFRFFALDVETANYDRSSICQLGLACVREDNSIETWVTLVDPKTDRWVFSDLHGITRDMAEGAPTIGAVITFLEDSLTQRTIYQHSGFDRSAIRAACNELDRVEPNWHWQDSVSVARTAWPELKGNGGHGLASLKTHLGLRFEHHDAGEDARAAAQVVLFAEQGVQGLVDGFDVLDDEDDRLGPANAPSAANEEMLLEVQPRAHGAPLGRSTLTQGNLNNNHFYLKSFLSSFPADVIGGSNKATAAPRNVTISYGGTVPVMTDIDGTKKIFRDRSWVRSFFECSTARAGDAVEVFERAPYCYEVKLIRA